MTEKLSLVVGVGGKYMAGRGGPVRLLMVERCCEWSQDLVMTEPLNFPHSYEF